MPHVKARSKPLGANPGGSSAEVVPEASPFTAWRLRGCSRCGGDLWRRSRGDGWCCLQCSFDGETLIAQPGRIPAPRVARKRRALQV